MLNNQSEDPTCNDEPRSLQYFRAAALSLAILIGLPNLSGAQQPTSSKENPMYTRDLYPLITSAALFDARDFYVKHFHFDVAFEATWFVYLTGQADGETRGATLAFMHPDHPSKPPGPESFEGQGLILTIEVADAAEVFERLRSTGAPIVYPLTDEAWGQRRFVTRDPAGVLVDVVQQIDPKQGFWEQYMIK